MSHSSNETDGAATKQPLYMCVYIYIYIYIYIYKLVFTEGSLFLSSYFWEHTGYWTRLD